MKSLPSRRGPRAARGLTAALALASGVAHAALGFSGSSVPFDAAYTVLIADLNGDGITEIIGIGSGQVCVHSAGFVPGSIDYFDAFTVPTCFGTLDAYAPTGAVVDLNGDGLPDIVTTNQGISGAVGSASLSVLMNASRPGGDIVLNGGTVVTAPPTVAVGTYPDSITTADFNGDGKPDLATANLVDGTVSVLLNTTPHAAMQPSFAPQLVLPAPDNTTLVVAADMNNDGKPDLLVAGHGTLVAFFNTTPAGASQASFTAAATVGSSGSEFAFPTLAVADFDRDGRNDVILPDADEHVRVLLNRTPAGASQPTFDVHSVATPGITMYTAAAADIDGDGRPDVVLLGSDSVHGRVGVLLNQSLPSNGYGGFSIQTYASGVAPSDLAIGDVNGDQRPDIVIADYGHYPQGDGGIDLLLNTTGLAYANLDQQGLTGSWYNPRTGGQGFELEVYPDRNGPGSGLFTGGWFTYDKTGGARRWYFLSGNVAAGAPIGEVSILRVLGGSFDDPTRSPGLPAYVGGATVQFSDCNHGQLHYFLQDSSGATPDEVPRTGIVPLVRLVPQTNCSSTSANGAVAPASLLSGNWYNPATSGQGLIFDVSPSAHVLFAAWYTFDIAGTPTGSVAGQNWFTLQAPFTDGTVPLHDVPIAETSGGAFDAPDPVASVQVGSADIAFQSCSAMTLAYRFTAGSNAGRSGTIALQRVGPTPAGCALK